MQKFHGRRITAVRHRKRGPHGCQCTHDDRGDVVCVAVERRNDHYALRRELCFVGGIKNVKRIAGGRYRHDVQTGLEIDRVGDFSKRQRRDFLTRDGRHPRRGEIIVHGAQGVGRVGKLSLKNGVA